MAEVESVRGVGKVLAFHLRERGLTTAEALAATPPDDLVTVPGIGASRAMALVMAAREAAGTAAAPVAETKPVEVEATVAPEKAAAPGKTARKKAAKVEKKETKKAAKTEKAASKKAKAETAAGSKKAKKQAKADRKKAKKADKKTDGKDAKAKKKAKADKSGKKAAKKG